MAAAAYFDTVQKIFIAFYQRPADPAGLKYWADRIDAANGDAAAVVSAFATSPEAATLYGPIDATTIGTVIDKIYLALFNTTPDAPGKQFYVDGFTAGKFTAGTIALNILNGAANDDAVAIANKLQVSNTFTQQVDGRALTSPYFGTGTNFNATYKGDADAQAARDILKTVTASPATVLSPAQVTEQIQNKIADAGDPIIVQTSGETFTLTAGIDNLTGTAGNDTFNAPITDGGTPTQTLTGLDSIDGGAGVDTLNVDFGGSAAALPGSATIKNIEVITAATKVASAGFDVSSVAGLQEVNLLQSGAVASAIINAGTATKASITGGTTAAISGKAITEVTVTKANDSVTIDNLNATTGVTSTGTTLTSVTLDGVVKKTGAAAHAFKGDAINTVTLKNIVGAGTNDQASTITNAVSKDLTVNVDNVGYELSGAASTGVTSVTAGAKAENITVNATGAKSAVTVTAAAAKNLTITGSADLTLAGISGAALKFIDGSAATGGLTLGTLNAGTADVKTGSGNDSFEIKATKVTVDAGAGDDTVTLGSTLAIGSTVNLGAGNDVLLSASGAVSAATTAGTVTIDGGDGIDTVAASLINATNAKQFLNFERIDASAGSTNLDVELMTGSTIDGITLNGGNGTVTLQNVAAGAGLTVAGANTGSLTVGVKGAATNTADSFDITFAGKASATATAGSPDSVSATKVGLQGVEAVNVASGGTGFVANSLSLNSNTELKTVTITGDKALALSLAGAAGADTTFGGTTTGKGVSSFDGSAATGKLTLDFSSVLTAATSGDDILLNIAASGLSIKGGSADDIIKVGAFSSTLTGGAGNDAFFVEKALVLLTGATTAATAVKTTITDFAAGDTIDLSAETTISTTLNKVTLDNTVQNLDDALSLVGTTAKTAYWFNYGADTYVVLNGTTAGTGLTAGDTFVKLTGTVDLSNATIDANGVLALA